MSSQRVLIVHGEWITFTPDFPSRLTFTLQLIASSLILNNVSSPNQYTLHPYLHSFSNIRSTSDLLTPLTIPDVLPSDVGETQGDFSFAAGDFLEIYRSEHGALVFNFSIRHPLISKRQRPVNKQDVILTCFFIDTARNIVEYLQTIHRLLKPGGTWINLGPTLWHFENTEGASSVELTMEDVKALARRVGFRLEVSLGWRARLMREKGRLMPL